MQMHQNTDKKGLTRVRGVASRAKFIARVGRRPPRATHDGARELITVIEFRRLRLKMLVPMVVFKGTPTIMDLYGGYQGYTRPPSLQSKGKQHE